MKEVIGNIWDYHKTGSWIVITTNGSVKKNGEVVMGKGVALQTKLRFLDLPYRLGQLIRQHGNRVFELRSNNVISFPVKHNWEDRADLNLIEKSCRELLELVDKRMLEEVYLVRPGCGNGGLDWKDVKLILERYLDDRFVVVSLY